MEIPTTLIIFSVFSLQLLCKSYSENCAPTHCSYDEPWIQFPFRIKDVQNKSCGSPGFDVHCNSVWDTLLELPSAGRFIIGSISYDIRQIKLSDPGDCLPKKLIALDLTRIGPFRPQGYSANFSLYKCSGTYHDYLGYDIIDCLSGTDYTVISAWSHTVVLNSKCLLWKNVSAPGYYSSNLSFSSSIYLTWDAPYCELCDSLPHPPPPPLQPVYRDGPASRVPTIVVVVLLFPAVVILFVCCTCIICCTKEQQQRNQPAASNATTTPATAHGLDQNIIDLYPVMIIGESGRLITPDDATCPICLSDYAPHEMLKVLPECLHRFHADCLDQWLRAKATCPICKISPPRNAADT